MSPLLHIIYFTKNCVLDKNTFEKADYDLSDHNRGGFQKNGIQQTKMMYKCVKNEKQKRKINNKDGSQIR